MQAEDTDVSFDELMRQLLLMVMRRRRLVVGVYVAVVIGAMVNAFTTPPQYRASAKILFTSDRAQLSTSSDRTTELLRTNSVGDNDINSQLQILRGRELVERVLRDMAGSEEPARVAEPASTGILGSAVDGARAAYHRLHGLQDLEVSSPLSSAAYAIVQRIEATRIESSNVIEVGFVDANPRWARDFVSRLTQAYIEQHASLQRILEAEDFFTKQSRLLQEKLAASEAALQAMRRDIGAQAGQQDAVTRQLNEFSAELARTKISREEIEGRVAYLARLKASGGSVSGRGRVATPELLALEARRVELLGRYKPGSQRVRDIDEQIERLRGAVAAYDVVNSAPEAEQTDLVAANAALAAVRGREEALAREYDSYREQAERLETQSFELSRLERQARLDEEAYLSYVRTAEQSRLSNALEQSKLLRLKIIEPAEMPMEPVAPRKARILTFALVGGLVAGIGAALARDYFDATLKSPMDVRRYASLEVLTTLPDRG